MLESMKPKISFVMTYCTVEKDKHLLLDIKDWISQTDSEEIRKSTIAVINNINKYCEEPHEIILVDNSHTWEEVPMDNLRVIKGVQTLTKRGLKEHLVLKQHKDYEIIKKEYTDLKNLTMHVSLGMYLGSKEAKGDYVVLQHNDFYYHGNYFKSLMREINKQYAYISVDSKKIWLGTYAGFKEVRDILGKDVKFSPFDGGYVRTEFGVSDMYFFMAKREFFNEYDVDWKYGDSNHGATIKCIQEDRDFHHMRPYYDNPNFPTAEGTQHTYYWDGKKFGTHLKGGISENKMSNKMERDKWLRNL